MTAEEDDEVYLVRLIKKGSTPEQNEYSYRAVGFLRSKLDAEAEPILEELHQMCLAKKKRPFQGDNKPRVRMSWVKNYSRLVMTVMKRCVRFITTCQKRAKRI